MNYSIRLAIAAVLFTGTAQAQQGGIVATTIPAQASAPVASTNGFGYSYSDDPFSGKKVQDLKSREVSHEISIPKGAEIFLENTSRPVQFKTWDQPKVKIVATAYFENETKLSDEELLEKMNISLKVLGSSVKIKSGSGNRGSFTVAGQQVYNLSGTISLSSPEVIVAGKPSTSIKRNIIIYVPAGSKVDIESRYSDLELPTGINEAVIDISNGNLEAENLNKLRLRSRYSNANIGDVKEAEVEFANGRFTAKNVDDLDIESKYSTIEMASAKKIVLSSTNDEFEVEDVTDIRGRKNYGNLRITRLAGSIEIDGSNADIKVRNVGAAVKLIKIDNRYADIRIPLRNNKNYSVDFAGNYSSVYGDFEKKAVLDSIAVKEVKPVTTAGTLAPAANARLQASSSDLEAVTVNGMRVRNVFSATGSGYGPSKFTATVGDGKGLNIQLKCQNCTVDFK